MNHYNQLPKIRVDFLIKEESIQRVSLVKSDKFSTLSKNKMAIEWMDAYIHRRKLPELKLAMELLSPFSRQVLESLRNTEGLVTYLQLAKMIGNPSSSRAVGGALNKNPFPLIIPCHRVISSSGEIGGYAYGSDMKKELLLHEGLILA